ncbi:MAG TPA: AsmA-like C-terminal region-containing protein, partial [Methylomirabilota bacterium]|nr:AsmA-like C-terminal region-containing protein [Methylomirabilota bacterium]
RALSGGSPLDYESITGTYRAANGVVNTRDLVYTSPGMKISVAGDYALASGRMDLDVVVHHARGEVKAKVTGTAAAPSVRLAPGAVLRDVDPGAVQRGLQDILKRFR